VTARPPSGTVTGRPPTVVWRQVPEDRFPLLDLLRLLFELGPQQDETEGGADAVA
jgi:hypothetical protein